MTKERALILATLIPFIIFTDIALFNINSWDEMVSAFTSHLMVEQVVLDFAISFVLISIWVWQDAKTKGVNPVPYMALMWLTGSIGVLIYLYRHVFKKKESTLEHEAYRATA